jgi:hypothetical protein
LLLANVLNYALGEWLDQKVATWAPPVASADGSTLNTSRFYTLRADTSLAGLPDAEALLDFYSYLAEGGSSAYLTWKAASKELRAVSTPFMQRAMVVANSSNTGKYLSLLLLIISALLLFGRGFKESNWLTPVFYFGIMAGTAALFGNLSSPLFTVLAAGLGLLYFGSLRLFLPIYHTEWSRLMRPGLTPLLFLLGAMALRGPELVDFWFWTSSLFRLALISVCLMAVYFHFSILATILKAAKMDGIDRLFSFGIPFGITVLVPGLFLGLYGKASGDALRQLNLELIVLPPETIEGFNPNAPFVLFFAGVMLLILSGIGHYIQKIAK